MRNMDYLFTFHTFDTAESQIVILTTFPTFAKTTNVAHQGKRINSEVAEHVVAAKQDGVPVRLEIRIEALSSLVDLVFIGVNESRLGMYNYSLGDVKQGVLGQHVVMIQEGYIVTAR